jgi:hypothetical protein
MRKHEKFSGFYWNLDDEFVDVRYAILEVFAGWICFSFNSPVSLYIRLKCTFWSMA